MSEHSRQQCSDLEQRRKDLIAALENVSDQRNRGDGRPSLEAIDQLTGAGYALHSYLQKQSSKESA